MLYEIISFLHYHYQFSQTISITKLSVFTKSSCDKRDIPQLGKKIKLSIQFLQYYYMITLPNI